jgi:hypothetical protein
VWSDGTDFTLLVGDGDGLSVSTNGRVRATSLGVDMLLDSAFSVSLGEGADTLSLDTVVGFNVLVEPGKRITLNNANVCRYFIDPGTHVFTVPNAAVDAEVTNLTLSSVGDAPAVGFLGGGVALKQSIVGSTVQEQVDSIVGALVAFGLVTDARTSLGTQSQLGWAPTAAGQQSNVLTLMPAGHQAGFYLVGIAQMVRTVSASAVGQETFTWSNGGAQTISTGSSAANSPRWSQLGLAYALPGPLQAIQFPRFIYSDGISAITVQVTAAATVATPVIDLYAQAQLISAP